jgi:DNA-directed RNA polymerase specialized sigma24 family protein
MSPRKLSQWVSCRSAFEGSVTPDPYLLAAIAAADSRVRRARWSARLSADDAEDLHQEILTDLLKRRPTFDRSRGSEAAFAGLLSAHKTADFLSALNRDRRRLAFVANQALDQCWFSSESDDSDGFGATPDGRETSLGGTSDFYSTMQLADALIDETDVLEDGDFERDFEIAVSLLSADQAALLEIIKSSEDLPRAAKASGMASATFYRRVSDLLMFLRMFGIRSGG